MQVVRGRCLTKLWPLKMHELSVCYALVAQVEKIARAHGAIRVVAIRLEVGPLSGVEPQLLSRAYPLAIAGTIAEHSELTIGACEVRVHCSSCGEETPVQPNRLLCGKCGEWRTRVIGGDELVLQSVEFEPSSQAVA